METAAAISAQRHAARAEPRTNLFVLATIVAGSASGPVKVRNLSPGGALVEGASLPSVGDRIELRRGASSVSGKVAWCHECKAGLQFDGRVEVAEWMPGGHAGQQRVDRVFAELKAEPALAARLAPASAEQDFALDPSQLRKLARSIDALADDLAEDGAIVARFAAKLQTLDLASQVLRKLSDRGG